MAETVRIEIPIEVFDNTDPELGNAIRGIDRLGQAADRAGESAQRSGRRVTEFDRSSERTQRTLSQWMKEKYEILLEAKDRIAPVLSAIGGGIRNLAGKAWSVTMKAADFVTKPVQGIINLLKNPIFQVGAVLGVSIGMKDTIETYKDFEAAMSQVQAVSGATAPELEQLTDKAKEMGATTKFTAEESATAFNYMAMAGWKTQDMLSGIEGILNLAAASGESLGTTSDIVTDALTAFGLQASDAGHFADVLAQASSNANTNVSMLGESFKYVAPVAGAMKYNVEDVSLALGLMANASVKGSMAGTSLKTALVNMASPTDKMATAMKKYGISLTDSDGKMKTLKGVMDNLRTSLGGLAEAEQTAAASRIFGKEAMAGMLSIINASEKDYNKLTKAVNNADGAAKNMSETMLNNLQGSITLLQSAADGVKISTGERLAPYVRGIADWMTEMMPEIESGLGELMDFVDRKINSLKAKFAEISATEEWQNADIFGKVKIAWDEIIAQPFSEWWESAGKAKIAGMAGGVGEGIGSALKTGILTLLGIDVSGTLDEGASIGASFAKGFSEGFDFEAISGKLTEGLKNMVSNAAKLLPGGEAADLSSLLSAGMLAKVAGPLLNAGIGGVRLGRSIFGSQTLPSEDGETTVVPGIGRRIIGNADAGTGLLGVGSSVAMRLRAGNLASGASLSTGALSALGLGAVAGGAIGGVSAISGGMDVYRGFTADDKEEAAAYKESGAWKLGGVGAGAAAGAAIGSVVPVVGTAVGGLIGAGVGGIAGWLKGNKVKDDYKEKLKEQEEAEAKAQGLAAKTQQVFELTGVSIDSAVLETQELKDAMDDAGVSAEQFGAMFQEAVGNNLKSHFGDLKLSLKETQDLAESIVFDKQEKGVQKFSDALGASESSLSGLKKRMQEIDRLNWEAELGIKMSKGDISSYKDAMDALAEEARSYLKDKHYEANVAVNMLVGKDNADGIRDSLKETYAGLQSQIDEASAELQRVTSKAFKDGVISTEDMVKVKIGGVKYEMDEAAAVTALQNQIAEITNKVAGAQQDAKLEALKIRYSGAQLDAESFANLQQELQADVESFTESYSQALEVGITNLKLQLGEGAIDKSTYEEQLKQLAEGYDAQIDEMQVRVESFQLDTIAESYGSALDGILPDIEGTTSEKLSEAMQNALAIEPEPAEWSAEQIASWFGLESLGAETQAALSEILQQTAETIPQKMSEEITSAMSAVDYSGLDLAGPFSNEYIAQMQAADLSAGANALAQNVETGTAASMGLLTFAESGAAVTNGVGSAIQAADMSPIASAVDTLKSNTDAKVNSAFGAGVSTTMPVNVTADYRLLNPAATVNVSGAGSGNASLTATISGHAAGGYVQGRQLSWLAEEGYGEFVIPTNPGRRARALELYEQAGKVLGVSAHADGGFVGNGQPAFHNYMVSGENAPLQGSCSMDSFLAGNDSLQEVYQGNINYINDAVKNAPRAYNETKETNNVLNDMSVTESGQNDYVPVYIGSGNSAESSQGSTTIQVSVQMSPAFNISSQETGKQGTGDIMQAIRRHMSEIADEVGGEIADRLSEAFANMALEGV